MNAIIGYTGFIGGILKKSILGDYFNSTNIKDIKNKTYNTVYCAGVSSIKWVANKYPIEDEININNLLEVLQHVNCNRFILISTIGVYDDNPYGINRKKLEDNLIKTYGNKLLIVRLPAVYGDGLKKNQLFDMLNDSLINKINICDKYQWYNVNNIKLDIDSNLNCEKNIVEFFTEPITNEQLISLFNKDFVVVDDIENAYIQNKIPKQGYLYSSNKVLKDLKKFIDGYR